MNSYWAKSVFSSLLCSRHRQSHHLLPLSTLLLRCSLSTQSQQQEVEMPFIARYLISSFGYSADWALKVSNHKKLTHIKASKQPDSVVSFLKEIGLSDSQIKSLIKFHPRLLCSNVDKFLWPRARVLMDAGFGGEILAQLILSNPQCLCLRDTLSRLQFWRNFLGGSDEVLLKVLQRNMWLISFDVHKHVLPRLKLMNEFGLSNRDIKNVLVWGSNPIFRSLESLRRILEQTKQLGFTRGSAMFAHGLKIVGSYCKETLERKVEFYTKTYGWPEEEFASALAKFPGILVYSEEKVKLNMEFLVTKLNLEPRSMVSRLRLLGFSLEKRLVPRHHVLSILQSKGLKKNWSFFSAIQMSEEHFVNTFLVPHEKDVPELAKAYVAAKGGKVVDLEKIICDNMQM